MGARQLKLRAARFSALVGSGAQPNSRRSSPAFETLAASIRQACVLSRLPTRRAIGLSQNPAPQR